jgi:nickel/cobalt transporter (NicO) family protein
MTELQRWLYGGATSELKALAAGADPATLLAALALAALFGFVHAFMPGHGKTAIVSYYLGHAARLRHGIVSSAILVLSHVGSAAVLVLAGFTVIRATLGGAGRAPLFEAASAVLIMAIGAWLLTRAVQGPRHEHAGADGRVLALATGLVPCPLTTFIMVYAVAHGMIAAGLLLTAAMAAGMIATIVFFAGCTIFLRERAMRFFENTASVRARLGRILETASAVMIILFGAWLFATRAT